MVFNLCMDDMIDCFVGFECILYVLTILLIGDIIEWRYFNWQYVLVVNL